MELVLHSSAGWVQLVCTILWLPLWFLSLLFCFLFAFLFFSSRHFAFYGQAFAISFPCLTQSMIRCVHSSNSSSRATIRSRNRSRSKQPEHFRWLAATTSAVAPLLTTLLLSPFCLSVCLCCVVLSSAHETPTTPRAPFCRWGCLFSVLYTFHVMRKLNSFRYRTMITFGSSPLPDIFRKCCHATDAVRCATRALLFYGCPISFLVLVICLCCGETCLSLSLSRLSLWLLS